MKFSILIYLIFHVFSLQAQSVDDAYKREKGYLRSQKESLLLLRSQMHTMFLKHKLAAEKDILKLQKELSTIELKNQEMIEELKAVEKITKESSQLGSQIEKQNLKIDETLTQVESKLGISRQSLLENDPVLKLEKNLELALSVVNELSKNDWRQHAFLNENDELVSGQIKFNGLYSAYGRIGDKIYNLAPYNKDFLKIVPHSNENMMYIFTPDFNKVNILAAKTWKESVADKTPAIVMVLIMLTVFGLFIMLARS